jgi:hypothetical protein
VCARVGNQRSCGVVTALVRTDTVWSLRHQRQDLQQSTYPVPLRRSGLILLSQMLFIRIIITIVCLSTKERKTTYQTLL